MVQGFKGYTPQKAAAQQVMTTWDHKYVLWMENIMATAYGVSPYIAMELPTLESIPPKFELDDKGKEILDDKGQPKRNPAYAPAVYELGKQMSHAMPYLYGS